MAHSFWEPCAKVRHFYKKFVYSRQKTLSAELNFNPAILRDARFYKTLKMNNIDKSDCTKSAENTLKCRNFCTVTDAVALGIEVVKSGKLNVKSVITKGILSRPLGGDLEGSALGGKSRPHPDPLLSGEGVRVRDKIS